MANSLRSLVGAIVCAPCLVFAQASSNADENAGVGDMLLQPSTITITGHFETAPGPTTLELALRALEQQMDRKRAEDAARSSFELFWKNPLWRFVPTDPGGTLNSPVGSIPARLDNPFCTPAYLTFTGQQLDREMVLSEKQTLWFFSR
jgi:hypothetical protein